MTERVDRAGLQVAQALADFVEQRALPGTGVAAEAFWAGFAELVAEFGPRIAGLLETRARLQDQIDDWHRARAGNRHDPEAYAAFLT